MGKKKTDMLAKKIIKTRRILKNPNQLGKPIKVNSALDENKGHSPNAYN